MTEPNPLIEKVTYILEAHEPVPHRWTFPDGSSGQKCRCHRKWSHEHVAEVLNRAGLLAT